MTRIRLRAPSRLHFGLLGWGPDVPRQFGGVGLMIDRPGLEMTATPAPAWSASGPLADRALRYAGAVASRLEAEGLAPPPAHLQIDRAPPEHVGLGTGTQLGLAVARLVSEMAGRPDLPATRLAELSDRGLRSGIGLHGFERGGLIVDGGRRSAAGVPPLLCRLEFPPDWHVLVVCPDFTGLHGPDELRAFATLPPIAQAESDRLCRLVLLGLLPAAAEGDLPRFGQALTELQALVGRCFAPAQGGPYARPELGRLVDRMRGVGLHGVGQSSWGPTLYGFSDAGADEREAIRAEIARRPGLAAGALTWADAAREGATLVRE